MTQADEDEGQTDLFAPLMPPKADLDRLVGTIDGPRDWHEGLGAGLRCWCGPIAGWRTLGELAGAFGRGQVTFHEGRLRVALAFDLGPHSVPRRAAE